MSIATRRQAQDTNELEKGLPVQEKLGTIVAKTYTTVAADATADVINIDTGLSTISTYSIQIFLAGVEIPLGDLVVTKSGGVITLTEDTTTVIAADWEVHIIARGA